MKTLDELKHEISLEAENNIVYAISERRAKLSTFALLGAILITVIYLIFFTTKHSLNELYLGDIGICDLSMVILLILLSAVLVTGLNIRVLDAIRIKKNTKFNYRVQTEYLRLVAERMEFYPENIKDLEKSIEDAKSILKDHFKECEEDIQGYEKEIEETKINYKLLQELEPNLNPKNS